jgi:ribonuclease R
MEALMLDRGLRRAFPRAVEDDARQAPAELDRLDLTALPTFTIDPVSARDFDDAISARREDGRIRLWVHIADVTAHVRPGTALDAEAYRRGTSVYVPGAVEPMLPEALSNEACSLVPHQDRSAVTVELEMDGERVASAAFHRTVIRSDARLDYPQVDQIFAGRARGVEPWAEALAAARAVAASLRDRGARRGSLAVESQEPEFEFDERGDVVAAHQEAQTESHNVIEELMILANEQVATLLAERRLPTLYRVHERPDPARVELLVQQLESLDVPTPPLPDRMSPQQAADFVGEISHRVAEEVRRAGRGRNAFTSLVLRSLKQAYYSPDNIGHAGLASDRYCHFTSPIRR